MGTHVVATGPISPEPCPPPPKKKASKLLFVGGSMAFGVCRNSLSSPPAKLLGQNLKKITKHIFDIVTTEND